MHRSTELPRCLSLPLLAVALVVPLTSGAQSARALDARADSLLRRMTLAEKVGEMTQLTINAVSGVRGTASVAQQLDSAKLEDVLVKRNVGSLLNVWDVALTPAQWSEFTTTIQRFAARKRLRIPVIFGIDAVHGHHYMKGGTVFPQNLAMAATWNPSLVRLSHQITAYETRASGIPWNFAPVLDLGRQPLWSRFPETFGEDVHLVSTMGVAAVEGEQRDAGDAMQALLAGAAFDDPLITRRSSASASLNVASTAKHFLGYGMPLSGKDRTTAWIPVRQLREYYVPSFATAIDAGIATVMVNSGDVNGIPLHGNRELLTRLLRMELGFQGVVVSDWEDIVRLNTVHRVAATRLDAVQMALDAGIDMSMVPYTPSFIDDVLQLVRAGRVSEARIDRSVRRILRLKLALGLFEHAGPDSARLANAGSAPFAAVSRRAAEEAITLLKNGDALLPLAGRERILVTGPGATSLPSQFGGWSYTWQGTDTAMYPKTVRTLLDAVRARAGADRVRYVPGVSHTADIDIPAAVAAAREADVVIVALAEPASAEKPGDIDDLTLPAAQRRLAHAIEATGTPVVVTLFEGRPRIVREIVDSARAIVMGYQTGPFGGEAMAAVLFGDVNPSGRLPFSYPRQVNDVEHYDRLQSADVTSDKSEGGYHPEWDFGFGLSYTRFMYSALALGSSAFRRADTITVAVTVTNSGSRAGMEVVQLYVRQMYASVDPPMHRLRAFRKIALASGETRRVVFRLPVSRLAFVGRSNRMRIEPGEFEAQIGGLRKRFDVR